MNRRRFLRSSVAGALALAHPGHCLWATSTSIAGDIEAATGVGSKTVLDKSTLQNLRDSLRGSLFLPNEAGYDLARRVLDQSIDKRPALVVQPSGVADIKTAVDFARTHALLLAVKCGGHSGFRSSCEGGMQIDLSRVRGVRIDAGARVAHVAVGSLLGDIDHEAMSFGLATPAGVVSHTGVGGRPRMSRASPCRGRNQAMARRISGRRQLSRQSTAIAAREGAIRPNEPVPPQCQHQAGGEWLGHPRMKIASGLQ